jgi:hypothetical protein
MERYKPLLKWFVIVSTSVTTSFVTSSFATHAFVTQPNKNIKIEQL